MVIMDSYEPAALMRCIASIPLNGLSNKIHALIGTTTSLNFVNNKEFVMANGFYKDYYKTASKLAIREASEHRISTTKIFCPSVFTIDEHEFTDL